MGRFVGLGSIFLKSLGWKNIKNIKQGYSDEIIIEMKEGPSAGVKFLPPGTACVVWSVEDFEHRAEERDNEYDSSKFEDALHQMIHKHDATLGISWDTIDFWLDEICLKVQTLDMAKYLYNTPFIEFYKNYLILGQSESDVKSKKSSIDRGNTFGFYTVEEIERDYYEEIERQTDTNKD